MAGIRTVAIWVSAVLVGAGLCAAQNHDGVTTEQLPVFTDLVEVNLINVFVTVTDHDGAPVTGLEVGDFEVFEDGKPVEITNFGAFAPAPASAPAVEQPVPVETPAPVAGPMASQPRYLTILFDNPSLRRRDRRRVIEDLRPFVGELARGGVEVMIATADSDLQIDQGFTSSEAELSAALDAVAESQSDGDSLMTRKRLLERDIYRARVVDPRTPGFSQVQAQRYLTQIEAMRAQERDRVQIALDNLRELIRLTAGLGGRVNVLWVGENLTMQPAVDIYQLLYDKFSGEAELDIPERWGTEIDVLREARELTSLAQGGAITVHFLDAADPDREEGTADIGAPEGLSAVASEGGESVATMGTDLARRRSATEGESFIAGATGGAMLAGSRNIAPYLGRVADLVEAYYSIGYIRPGEPDGELHSIDVRVNRKGVTVRTQERVRTVPAQERLGDVALARLRLDAGANDLGVSLRLGEARAAENRRKATIQDVQVSVPIGSLLMVPIEGGAVAQLMVAIRILDRQGVPSRPQVDRGPVAVPDGAAEVSFTLPLMIPDGAVRAAIAVRDELSGAIGSAVVPLAR